MSTRQRLVAHGFVLSRARRRLLSMLAALAMIAGCYPAKQYREASTLQAGDCPEDAEPKACSYHLREPAGRASYALGVVEFDDQGATYRIPQLEPFLRSLQGDDGDYAGRIVVVFAHGWFHDARPADSNLRVFSEMLEQFSAAEQAAVAAGVQTKRRRVVGVYLGWRGAAWKIPGLKYVTFWSRKDAAHRVGQRQATEALLRIREAAYDAGQRNEQAPNRFVVMGHSFGAALVYSALSQLIARSILATPLDGVGARPMADAVILFNAAFEAARVHHLLDDAPSAVGGRPVLTLLTAKNDRATGWAFPVARWLNNVFGSFRDLPNPIKRGTISERSSNARTIGHFAPYLTHDMVAVKDAQTLNQVPDPDTLRIESIRAPIQQRANWHDRLRAARERAFDNYDRGKPLVFGQTRLVPRSDLAHRRLSVFNVAMDTDIWSGHGLEQSAERRKRIMSFLLLYVPFAAAPRTERF